MTDQPRKRGDEAALKPCPFCGQKPLVSCDPSGDAVIECGSKDCNLVVKTLVAKKSAAIKRWNTRKGETSGYMTPRIELGKKE